MTGAMSGCRPTVWKGMPPPESLQATNGRSTRTLEATRDLGIMSGLFSALDFVNEARERVESLKWCHRIGIHLCEFSHDRMGRKSEERELVSSPPLRSVERRRRVRRSRHDLFRFEDPQKLLCARQHRWRQPGKPPHLDPVRAVGPSSLQPVQKQHLVTDFPHPHAIVTNCY